jgi:hypothetical protein
MRGILIEENMAKRGNKCNRDVTRSFSQRSSSSNDTKKRGLKLRTTLARLVKPAAIGPWLETPNPAFAGSTPSQVIERGETDRFWRMIYELESGQPG